MLTPTLQRRHLLEIGARLNQIAPRLTQATRNIRDQQPGYPTSSGGGSTPRLDAAGNPPGLDRYLDRPDPAAQASRRIDQILTNLLTQVTELHSIVTTWTTDIDPAHQPVIERRASGGDCLACGTYCSGASNDRLRSGLCNRCRMAWVRSGLERGEWMIVRRRELRDEQEDVA